MSLTATTHNTHGVSTREARPDWRAEAACHGMDTDIFYPEARGNHQRDAIRRAKNVCATCPVRRSCREEAAETPERFGIWAGMTEQERGWSGR